MLACDIMHVYGVKRVESGRKDFLNICYFFFNVGCMIPLWKALNKAIISLQLYQSLFSISPLNFTKKFLSKSIASSTTNKSIFDI